MVVAACLGALLVVIATQIPVAHPVDVGGNDAAYTRGFYDPEVGLAAGARWTREVSYLIFPQAGLPATIWMRVRGRSNETLTLRIDDTVPLAQVRLTGGWQDIVVPITTTTTRLTDLVIALRAPLGPVSADDDRQVGVLVDATKYTTGAAPLAPYAAQLAWGALAGALTALVLAGWRGRLAVGLALVLGYSLLQRGQPPYPYPLPILPLACAALAAVLGLRHGSLVLARWRWLPGAAALTAGGGWLIIVLLAAQQRMVLSVPGVENDFRVFALRSARLWGQYAPDGVYSAAQDGVLRADGFYNLGYPLLLWLVRPLVQDNPYTAALFVAPVCGVVLLAATYALARQMLGGGAALLALLALATSPFVVSSALTLGTDMPFAAACTSTLALLAGPAPLARWRIIAAGLLAGVAFLLRHPGLLLVPLGAAILWRSGAWRNSVLFIVVCSIAIAPQVAINLRDTGAPLYSNQAKNIWLNVYGGSDWQRWGDVPNSVTLSEVLTRDPGRVLLAWSNNIVAYIGDGTRAIQLELLGFPANWLGVIGLVGWLLAPWLALRRPTGAWLLLMWVGITVVTIALGLGLTRFFLVLAPVYAIAAAWLVVALYTADRWPQHAAGARAGARAMILLLAMTLAGGIGAGTARVLAGEPLAEAQIVRAALAALAPDETLAVVVPARISLGKYSRIADRVVATDLDAATITARGADLLILARDAGAAPPGATVISSAGVFTLYRLAAQ